MLDPHGVLASFDNFTYFLFRFCFCFVHHFLWTGISLSIVFKTATLFFKSPTSDALFQVAIHSVLEKLFRSIWSLPNSRAPFAIKYFFDFLDAQAENKKITDPDVVHIWKTNRWEQTVCDYWLFSRIWDRILTKRRAWIVTEGFIIPRSESFGLVSYHVKADSSSVTIF